MLNLISGWLGEARNQVKNNVGTDKKITYIGTSHTTLLAA